jgi:hypothetical protein
MKVSKSIPVSAVLSGLILATPTLADSYQFRTSVKGLTPKAESISGNSCKSILDAGGSTGSGVYTITPNGGPEIDVYCDMTADGGGWTLIAAQFETDALANWNEGIQPDYDPTLSAKKSLTLSSSEIPAHTQVAFGKHLQPTAVDFFNGTYTTGDIPKTTVSGLKTGKNFHLHRSSNHYYGYHDPDGATTTTTYPFWFNTLTFDEVGVQGFNWAFGPNGRSHDVDIAGYAMQGVKVTNTVEDYAWTVWVR